jgi:hypothetical protein
MDVKFWAGLDATRLAMERATASIDVSKLASAASTVQQFASTIDFDRISLSLAVQNHVFCEYERLSANSALVGETLASVIARSSGALPESNSSVLSALRFAVPEIPKFDIASSVLVSARALELARMNDVVVGALSSAAFDNLAAADRSIGRRLVGLSDSYRDIFTGMAAIEFALPDFVIDLPARDMIVKSTIVSSCAPDFQPTEAAIDLDDPAYARGDVDLMLAELNPEYVAVLDEAFEALAGRSLGRVRHLLVSLREIITHVLHDLSPNAEVIAWSTDPKHFDNGKPTRAGRYLYICRFVTYGAYGDYVKKSSGMTSAFFKLMNVLHDVRPDVGEFQLRLMLTDAIGILRFLLRTARYRP